MSLRRALALLATAGLVHAATATQWRFSWSQVGRSAPEGHAKEQSRRPPQAFAFSPDGTLLISDTFNQRVLRASTPPTTLTTLASPDDLAVHPDGRVLVADRTRYRLTEISTTSRAYGEYGTGPLQLLDVARVAWGAGKQTAAADDLGHRLVTFDDGKPVRSIPYDSFGFAFDPAGRLITPRFATLSGFVLARHDATGARLTTLPLDLASPLSIELLEVDAHGTALAIVPDPRSMDARQELYAIEPGGRAHLLWSGHLLDAARTFARHPDGTLYRASESADGYAIEPLPASVPATAVPTASDLPAPPAPREPREVWSIAAGAVPHPVALASLGSELCLVGADGHYVRGPAGAPPRAGRREPAVSLAGATVGPSATLLLRDAHTPVLHRGKDAIALEGWDHPPDLVTAAPGGQLLAHDRASGAWVRHDLMGKSIQKFEGAGAGGLDARSELITVQDADEPYTKVVMQFDCNGNFFKALATFKESVRPSGARFVGTAPGGDLVIGYWLHTRGVARRYTSDGKPLACIYFDLPPSTRTAVADWTLAPNGDVVIAVTDGKTIGLREVSW